MKKAVLFLTFNRLDTTKPVFEKIREAKPPRLYLASDGAREQKEGEKELVESVRNYLLTNIDWECEVKTLFREENLGCGKAVSGAITWFFEQEEDGIILEDDCLPDPTFFNYCETLLDYYKDDKRVWHIAGTCHLGTVECDSSYYFGKIMHCWGWASWADRWKQYQFNINNYNEKIVKNFSKRKTVQRYFLNILFGMKRHKIDTWDYQWTFTIVKEKGLCATSCKNLISNIGFVGVHFDEKTPNELLNKKVYPMNEIIHPKTMEFNNEIIEKEYTKLGNEEAFSLKSFIIYIKKYPLFFLRKDFWLTINTLFLSGE